MKKERQDMLFGVRESIVNEIKNQQGTFSFHTRNGEKHDFDFTITRKNGTKKNLKVYTTVSEVGNTAISETVLKKKKVDYVILFLEDKGTYVFNREDVIEAGKMTKDGRIHFASVLKNIEDYKLLEAKNNFKRIFLEF